MILACDPGLKGAFAWEDPFLEALQVLDMPTYTKAAGARKTDRAFLDEAVVCATLSLLHVAGAKTLVIEDVHGAPGQSGPASFMFGYGVGVVVTAARMAGYRIERVAPSVWKKALRVPSDKKASRARASELMPRYAHLWPLVKHDGRAEAAMIHLWATENLK